MMMLLAYPTLPATSSRDPNVPIPMGILELHRVMLAVKGFDVETFQTPCELTRCSLLLQTWESILKLHAYSSEHYRKLAARPSRATLIAAVREMNPQKIYDAYRACVEEADGDGSEPLSEISQEWRAILRLTETAT